MVKIAKINLIKELIRMELTTREIQTKLKDKFGSGVNNNIIKELRNPLILKEIPKTPFVIKEEEKDNKIDNKKITGKKNTLKKFDKPHNKATLSISKDDLWNAIKSDEDLIGLKTWFTVKPSTSKRKRRGLGDLVLVINELIKQKIDEKKWEENH